MTSFMLLVVTVSCSWIGSASAECTGGNSALIVPSSGPICTVCLPYDDYIQLQKDASSDGESTDAPPVSSCYYIYRYMSPLWLQTHANFTQTPSSVSAQSIAFGSGPTHGGVLFKVKLIEAGILNDDQAYSIQIGFFFTYPGGGESDSILQICDDNYCVGFWYWVRNSDSNITRASYGISCSYITAPQSSTPNWNIRLEIHPNSTSGITYVGTISLAYEYGQKLKPSRGLHFKVCRDNTGETYEFHLFELALYSNK